MVRRSPAQSRYARRVRSLLRTLYGSPPRAEQSVQELILGLRIPLHLEERMRHLDAKPAQLRIDFYVPKMVAVEVHGEQHDRPVRFSNEILDPEEALERRRELDRLKADLLHLAGIPMVTIWYFEIDDLTAESLQARIDDAIREARKVPAGNVLHVARETMRTRNERARGQHPTASRRRMRTLTEKDKEHQKQRRREQYRQAKARRTGRPPPDRD